ncbi:hypothetical protein SAMN04487819_111121 [Actinopolyspora alba]|uniref:Uncharacterized protein n=1 Tax=Actinopolyspora alba TaxID=673379 RepID=A0A1I1ZV13_9ACTN|nr:hypothetical protein SAMN04487819_111121 [Actinopolyspora alba]
MVVLALDSLERSFRLARAGHPSWKKTAQQARSFCPEICSEIVQARRNGTAPDPESLDWDAYLYRRTGLTRQERDTLKQPAAKSDPPKKKSGTLGRSEEHGLRRAEQRRSPHSFCVVCELHLPVEAVQKGLRWHKQCRPTECLRCGRMVPKNTTHKFRCKNGCESSRKSHSGSPGKHSKKRSRTTPWQRANLELQAAQRKQAKRQAELSPGPKSRKPPPARFISGGGLPEHNRRKH